MSDLDELAKQVEHHSRPRVYQHPRQSSWLPRLIPWSVFLGACAAFCIIMRTGDRDAQEAAVQVFVAVASCVVVVVIIALGVRIGMRK